MPPGTSAADCLPSGLPDAFLTRVFKLLESRQLFSVAALVCKQWHGLITSEVGRLHVLIDSVDRAQQLQPWLGKYKSSLSSVKLSIGVAVAAEPAVQSLLQTIVALLNLRDFKIQRAAVGAVFRIGCSFASCTSLTSLSIGKCRVMPAARDSLYTLTQLKALDLSTADVDFSPREPATSARDFLEGIAVVYSGLASLTQLTRLDIPNQLVILPNCLPQLRSLSNLQTLRIHSLHALDLSEVDQLPVTKLCIKIPGIDGGDAARWLQQHASRLQHLGLDKGPGSPATVPQTAALLAPLSAASASLQHLGLWRLAVGSSNMGHLTGLSELTSLVLDSCNMNDSAVRQLSMLTKLESLHMVDPKNCLGPDGCFEVSVYCWNYINQGSTRGFPHVQVQELP